MYKYRSLVRELAVELLGKENRFVLIMAPSLRLAKEFVFELSEFVLPFGDIDYSDMSGTLVFNGCRVVALSISDGDKIRGTRSSKVIIIEKESIPLERFQDTIKSIREPVELR
jgi:hypothetical protein